MRQGSNAGAGHCTSRQDNAHVTEEREVLYQWHPWFGRKVHVHQSVGRGRAEIFRCSLDGLASVRCLELPGWMFDPSVCLGVRVTAAPWASRSALAALQALLHDAAGMALPPSALPEPILDAGRESSPQNRRSSDAPTTPEPSESAVECPPAGFVSNQNEGSGLAGSAGGNANRGDEFNRAPAARASTLQRPRRHRGSP